MVTVRVPLARLTCGTSATQATYRIDTCGESTVDAETIDLLEFLTRVLAHIPDKGR
jgi:hypothetical protein